MPTVDWSWTADYIQACNCDWGCPCNWNAAPRDGHCHGFGAYGIRTGRSGALRLDGLHCAFTAKWPGPIHEGGGIGTYYIDDRATPEQRRALHDILRGAVGGMPFEILSATLARTLDPLFLPFDFRVDGPRSSVTIGTVAKAVLEPIKSPVMGNPVSGKVVLDKGFIFKEALVTSLDVFTVMDRDIRMAYPGRNGHYAVVEYPS